ncbi:MAG: PD-(D/E)XK nuclease family protein, partial [Gaiellales bacterium]
MPLRLLVGPANAGKVARLLDQYVRWLDEEPCLVVPNRGEVDRIEREILRRSPGVVGGWIGTFDDLFEQIAAPLGHGAVVSAPQRRLLLRRVSAAQPLNGLGRSARSDGFTDALAEAVREVESALVEPASLAAELAALVSSYRAGLLRVGLEDREGLQRIAVTRLQSDLDAWDRRPIVAYGFEDLTAAQWALLEGLSARAEVVVSLPYEPGRRVFEAVRPTADDLMRLASDVEELPPGDWGQADALAHLERSLFELPRASTPPLGGAVRFLEASGTRASLELVAEEILHLIASGTAPEAITVVCPDIERIRRSFELAFGAFGVPFVVDSGERLTRTSFGRALIALLRFAWQEGERSDLFAFLRSRFSGIGRSRVDFVEGRLRGRAVRKRDRVEAETTRLLEGPLELLDALRAGTDPVTAVRELAHAMMTAAWNPVAPSPSDQLGHDLLAHETVETVLGELAHWRELDQAVEPNDLVAALERARQPAPRAGRGRIVLTDLLRARTRRTEALVVVGLEEGVLPRRGSESPFLPDEERRRIDTATPRARLVRPDVLARDRYLFYAACTRA